MTEKDKKEFRLMMGEALELVVLPQLQDLRDDVKILKEDVKELKDTTSRIELKQNAEIVRHDKLSERVDHLEKICVK